MLRRLTTVALAGALAAPTPALADDYFEGTPSHTAVAVRQPLERSAGQRLAIYGLLGGAAVLGGVGVWAHLDSRAASREVEVSASDPVDTWTDARQDAYDRALRSRAIATGGYVMSAGLVVGAIVVAHLTRPGYETVVIEPTRGGAVVGSSWAW